MKVGLTPLVVLVCGVVAVAATASGAVASHYRLPADLVDADEHKVLVQQGIDTTLVLLERAGPVPERKDLAFKTGISFTRLTVLACQTDLLRVKGLGPSMVKLLNAAGVKHSGDLRRSEPGPLRQRLETANSVHRIAPVLPQAEVLQNWISQARRMSRIVEGVR